MQFVNILRLAENVVGLACNKSNQDNQPANEPEQANIFDYYVIKVIRHKSLHLSRTHVHANYKTRRTYFIIRQIIANRQKV